MSSEYPDYVKGTNPVYYWRMNRWTTFTRAATSVVGTIQEEIQTAGNNTSNETTTKSAAYWVNHSLPTGDTPRDAGPLMGGDSQSCKNFDTYEGGEGPRIMQTGDASATLSHEIPIGRNKASTINMWAKVTGTFPESNSNRMLYASSPTTNKGMHAGLFIRRTDVGGDMKVQFQHKTKNDTSLTESKVHSVTHGGGAYDTFDIYKWNMFTLTYKVVSSGTLANGIQIFVNGKLDASHDHVFDDAEPSPTTTRDFYWYVLKAANENTNQIVGNSSEVTLWDRVLTNGEISDLYYHSLSPSPARVRGGMNRQLGRLV